MDAVSSFSYLIENLPQWTKQVSELSSYTSKKHEEFKAEYTRIVSKAKPKRVKSPSICSIHTTESVDHRDATLDAEQILQTPDLTEISPFEAGNRYIYAQATKKRKPGTSFRSGASGPLKFRSKQMVVIYYDSYVQDQLDGLVKSIGGGRNNLRKGKMAYTISKGLQLPTLGRKYELSPTGSALDGTKSAMGYRSASKISDGKDATLIPDQSMPTGEAAFKQVDKQLETCQTLCETAAHQFLRDGDCKLELDTVVQNLSHITELASATFMSLKAEEKKEENSTESASMIGSSHTVSDTTLVEKSSREAFSTSQKAMSPPDGNHNLKRPTIPTIHSAPPMTTEIEVDDDSDQSSIEIDLVNVRSMNRRGLRT